ncbi:PatA/PatG family cyanobactin maturation protease [Bradyrhizobium sp. Cp5.3]|uniref:PatA/PatG family cyanobactin maturation protease n=1 Tax=Bradyrhizobium sp. Cp5.3 TaxID=443598 RepID=UPI000558231E|nr:PatA/PatG family cyanobactin maturation protease [Bradyrhizobium sp. Cp5.3]
MDLAFPADHFATSVQRVAQTLGNSSARIAVLDGPIDYRHSCFRGADLEIIETWVSVNGHGVATEHGTHVASVIFGQPGSEVRGIAPYCAGLVIPVFGDAPDGGVASCLQLDLARAILIAVDRGAHIINISGGQLTSSSEPEPLLADAIRTCAQRNILIVAAAGNEGCECLHFPAAARTVLAVGAIDSRGAPLASSNWGSVYQAQGLVAVGENVLGAKPGGGTWRKTGTSFATPIVSGVAGLLVSLQRKAKLPPDPHLVRDVLLRTARRCVSQPRQDSRRCLAGHLNVTEAISFIRGDQIMTNRNVIPSGAVSVVDEHNSPRGLPLDSAPATRLVVDTAVRPSDITIAAADPQLDGNGISASCGGDAKCSCHSSRSCQCGGKRTARLAYALGTIGCDFGSEARRDSFIQAMPPSANNPLVAEQLLNYLSMNPFEASSVIWTLNLDATPIYAIQPVGPYAMTGYERLLEAFNGQLKHAVELVSIPGVIGGSVRLLSGQVVPVIAPSVRGIFHWSSDHLVRTVLGMRGENSEERAAYDSQASGLSDFFSRVYYDLRNLGVTPEERALNYSAVNAVQAAEVIRSTTTDGFDLDKINIRRSAVCRPDSDCYDVELLFFNPDNLLLANRVFRFTVDVSEEIPVTIGPVRAWTRRSSVV